MRKTPLITLSAFVFLHATTTHAGPLSVELTGGGKFDSDYNSGVPSLSQRINQDIINRFNSVGVSTSDRGKDVLGVNFHYQLNDMFGLEAGYIDYGKDVNVLFDASDIPVDLDDPFLRYSIRNTNRYLAATATFDLSERWALTGRLGYHDPKATFGAETQMEREFLSGFQYQSGLYGGVSVDYALSDDWSVSLRHDNFETGSFSLGLKYQIGGNANSTLIKNIGRSLLRNLE